MAQKTTDLTPKEIYRTPKGAVRVQLNDVEQAGEGGRVALVADPISDITMFDEQKLVGVSLTFNFRRDEPMRVYPYDKVGMDKKRYTLVLLEEPEISTP